MRSISCTNIFIPHCHYEIFGYRPHPLPSWFCNSLSTHFPPFISILLPATGQLLSNLRLVKAHIFTQLYFLNCVPWNTSSVGCLYIESWIILLSQKGLRNSSLKKIKFFTERLSVSNILTSVANFPGAKDNEQCFPNNEPWNPFKSTLRGLDFIEQTWREYFPKALEGNLQTDLNHTTS